MSTEEQVAPGLDGLIEEDAFGEFTLPARRFWAAIPQQHRQRLLGNVWCGMCGSVTTIVQLRGRIRGGDLILTGRCAACGGAVARIVESD